MTLNKALEQDQIVKRLAKFMALSCFRNTELENLHAGMAPSSKTGDYSDVKVISPFGEIEWNNLSRFDDAEMKVLMIDVVNHCYAFLLSLKDKKYQKKLLGALEERDFWSDWEEPRHPQDTTGGRATGNYSKPI